MPSAAPPTPAPRPSPSVMATIDPKLLQPTLGPYFPKAGVVGVLVIAVAYFALGVAVGGLMKQSQRARRFLPIIVVPGVLAGVAFIAWVIRSLR